jgi:hypothetical protein
MSEAALGNPPVGLFSQPRLDKRTYQRNLMRLRRAAAKERATHDHSRADDLACKLLAALGNPTDTLICAAARQAAELSVLCEEARTAALAAPSDNTLIDNVIRLQRLADTAYSRLGMFNPQKNRSHHARQNTLGGYLNEAAE